jgi:hypothetical protein
MVTISWLMLPTMVSSIPFMGSAFSRMKALPKYSPTRLGVKILTVTPVNTALKEFKGLEAPVDEHQQKQNANQHGKTGPVKQVFVDIAQLVKIIAVENPVSNKVYRSRHDAKTDKNIKVFI